MLRPTKIHEYLSQYSVTWRLTMPSGCPPEDVEIPDSHNFLRLTHDEKGILTNEDLLTYSELDPHKNWGELLPLSKGLSLIATVAKAKKLLKLPNIRRQNLKGVAEICLIPTDGVVKQTSGQDHYTWWQTTSYNISHQNPVEL